MVELETLDNLLLIFSRAFYYIWTQIFQQMLKISFNIKNKIKNT